MKICQITYAGFGGLGSVVFSLIAADSKRSYQWSIGFIGDLPLDGSYPPRCAQYGAISASFRSISGKPYRAWLDLARWLWHTKPDAIICHSINSILACRWYAWWSGAKLIAVEHTPNQVKTRNEWIFSRLSMLLADRVVVLTDEYRAELYRVQDWLYRDSKISVIPNGIDAECFQPRSNSVVRDVDVIKLGMSARFSSSKRQDLLVAVMAKVSEIRPELNIELFFAGDGDEMLRVQRLAADSLSRASITFDGLLSEDEVAPWLRKLDIYVHATEGETLSTSLLQAMSTGLPIIASDIPGVNNLLAVGEGYGVCVPNDVNSFAMEILNMIENPNQRAALGLRARQRILNNYSNQMMLNRYLELIDSCR